MGLTKLDSLALDCPGGKKRSLELWAGDLASVNAGEGADYLALSLQPGQKTVCPKSVAGALEAKGLSIASLKVAADYRPAMPCFISDPLPSKPTLNFKRILFYEPSLPGFKSAQAAPYQVDSLFRAIDCFQSGVATSLTLPLLCCGQIAGAGKVSPALMLRMLFNAACKWGGVSSSTVDTIKIVLHSAGNSGVLVKDFALLKKNYENLNNRASFPSLPPSYGQPYSHYAGNTLNWIAGNKPKNGWPDGVTDLQVFGIHMYTTGYFHAMNDTLRVTDSSLPKIDGVGVTDLIKANFIHLQPLYAVTNAGLLNIKPYVGKTYRGISNLWNPFSVGSKVPILSYMSSAVPAGSLFKTRPIQITTTSLNARDISNYSLHPPENEHVYSPGMVEAVVSNNTAQSPNAYPVKIGTAEVDHKYCTTKP